MRFLLLLTLGGFASCQCVTVPPREYACEPGDVTCLKADAGPVDAGERDSGTPDAGSTDAGTPDSGTPDSGTPDSGTPDSGTPDSGALDAGTPDASVPCDGGICRFADGGFCESWTCVQQLWTSVSAPGSTGVRLTDLPAGVDGGQYGWFGGVLLPDGRVLAIAHNADRFLTFDPRNDAVSQMGPLVPGTERKYAGGVLARNGRVYVLPYQAHAVLELTPEDGGLREVGPQLFSVDGGAPQYVGGVLDSFGTVWSASESPDGLPLLRFDPVSGLMTFHSFKSGPWGGFWGLARLPDDRLITFPKEYASNPSVLAPTPFVISPDEALADAGLEAVAAFDLTDGGFALQGGSLTFEGHVCATPAGLEARVVCFGTLIFGFINASVFTGPVMGYGFNASFGDGRVWTSPDLNNLLARIAGDGGITTTTVQAGRYGYLGMVATPQGLVGIPGAPGTGFLLIQPGTALSPGIYDSRPLPVLLSPFFNKL